MSDLTAEEIAELRRHFEDAPLTNEQGHVLAQMVRCETMARLLDEVERSRALLKRIEWSANDGFECPACGAYHTHTTGQPDPPHKPGCELAALLGG